MSDDTTGDPESKHSLPDELRRRLPEAGAPPPERRETALPPPPLAGGQGAQPWQFPAGPGADAYPAAGTPANPVAGPPRPADTEVTSQIPVDRSREAYRAAPWPAAPAQGPAEGPQDRPMGRGTGELARPMGGAPASQVFGSAPAPSPVVGMGASLSQGLRQDRFTTEVKPRPRSGWRRALLRSTFGLINPGESRTERVDREFAEQIGANIPRTEMIFAVVSPRGGVSKTTTTAALGSMFAHIRGAEVVVIDADPNDGNLADRVNPDAQHTFADILRDGRLAGVNDIRSYTRRNASQLDVLAGSRELVSPPVYSRESLFNTINVLRTGYRIIGIDCGQNLGDELFSAILDVATAMVVVTGDQFDSAQSALKHYDRLQALGRTELRDRSFMLISDRSPKPNKNLRAEIEQSVSTTVWKNPVHVPFDAHLAEATVVELDQLHKSTYRSYLTAAARLASWYGLPPIPRGRR